METKNNPKYGYIAQTLILFGVNILMLITLAFFVGDGAKEISPLYQLGSEGLATSTMLQFLLSSAAIIALKNLFYSDKIFKRFMVLWRTVFMLFSVFILVMVFILIFDWFPLDNGMAWAGFLLCFGGSCAAASLYMIIKTKWESRHYNRLLSSYKDQHGGDFENE